VKTVTPLAILATVVLEAGIVLHATGCAIQAADAAPQRAAIDVTRVGFFPSGGALAHAGGMDLAKGLVAIR
jgi:hypothetical protein